MGLTIAISVVAFVAAAIGAVTGGNSLLTVPAMLLAGIDPRVAVATNMVASLALTLAATGRFLWAKKIPRSPTLALMALAVPGSVLGAFVAVRVPALAMRIIVASAMLGMALFMLRSRTFGAGQARPRLGYVLSFVWGVYGGLFSGGYTTVLTFGAVALMGVTLQAAVALTKPVNLVSCVAAVSVFVWKDAIDWSLALPIAGASLAGGFLGAHFALKISEAWLERAFTMSVVVLAVLVLAAEAIR